MIILEQLSCSEALFQSFGSMKIIEIENKTGDNMVIVLFTQTVMSVFTL